MPAEGIELLVMTAGALAFAVVFVQPAVRTRTMVSGAGGLVGAAAIVAAPTLDLVVFVLLALGVLHASVTGGRSLAVRLRPPLLAAAMISIALVLIRVQGPDALDRFAAVGIGAALAAAVGLLPYIHLFDPDEDVAASPFAWLAFIGPVLAAVLVARAQGLLSADAWTALGGILIGLGVLNMVWGTVAAWFCGEVAEAWRYSFIADWGLVLCGFGLTILDGSRGAFLALFGIVLCRLPLYLVYRSAPVDRGTAERPRSPAQRPLPALRRASCSCAAPRSSTGRSRSCWRSPCCCGCRARCAWAAASACRGGVEQSASRSCWH